MSGPADTAPRSTRARSVAMTRDENRVDGRRKFWDDTWRGSGPAGRGLRRPRTPPPSPVTPHRPMCHGLAPPGAELAPPHALMTDEMAIHRWDAAAATHVLALLDAHQVGYDQEAYASLVTPASVCLTDARSTGSGPTWRRRGCG